MFIYKTLPCRLNSSPGVIKNEPHEDVGGCGDTAPFTVNISRSRWHYRQRRTSATIRLLGFLGSNPADGMHFRLFVFVLCRQRPLRRADQSYRGVLPSVWLSVCDLETRKTRRATPQLGRSATEKKCVSLTPGRTIWKRTAVLKGSTKGEFHSWCQ